MEETFSACYEKRKPQWAMMRKLVAGGGEEKSLVIGLPGMPADSFASFKERAYYMNAVDRTIEAFSGLPLSKPVSVEGLDGKEHLAAQTTRSGLSVDGLARLCLSETLTTARVGILVDYPETSENMTVAQAEATDTHAFARFYPTEAILDFSLTTIGAKQHLSRVLLKEVERVEGEDVDQLRVVELLEGGATLSLYRKTGGSYELVGDPKVLTRANEPLRFIPFQFINPTDSRPECQKPPTLNLGETAKAHLNNSASYEWGLMWTAAPTPVFVGLRLDKGETVALGSSEGIQLEENGKAFFMEFTGQGLGALRTAMQDKQMDMAILGARLLSGEKNGVEAAETARIRKTGEQSALASICGSVSEGLTQVLRWMVEWDGGDGESVSARLNTDFLTGQIGFDELKTALELLQSGRMTRATFHSLMVKAELVAPTVSADDYQEELDDEAPDVPAVIDLGDEP